MDTFSGKVPVGLPLEPWVSVVSQNGGLLRQAANKQQGWYIPSPSTYAMFAIHGYNVSTKL